MTLIPETPAFGARGRVPHLPSRGFSLGSMRDDLVTVWELSPGTALWTDSPVAPLPAGSRCWLWPTGKSSSPGSRHTPLPQTGLQAKQTTPCVSCASEAGFRLAQNKPTHRAWFTPAPLGAHHRLVQQSPTRTLPECSGNNCPGSFQGCVCEPGLL